MEIIVKNIINIFTIIDGKINLLMSNNDLIKIECLDELELVNEKFINDNINIKNLNLKQCHTFSKKEDQKLNLDVLYIDIVNVDDIRFDNKFSFVDIDNIDKKDKYVEKSLEYLKKELSLNSTIKRLYPKEFILPEIQKIYEAVLNKKYDRRNFRKKLIKLDIIEDLNKMSSNKLGRPAKLYRFKEITEDKILF